MSSKFYVGMDLTGFENNSVQRPVSRVTLRVDEERVLTAGDDTGLELTADCPHATQSMVNAILEQVKGTKYQMYAASDINIDPAMELGDGITACRTYSVISRISDDGSGFPSASAPGQPELEDEYPAGGPMTQIINRKLAETRSRITKTAEEIRLEVERVSDSVVEMSASFSVQLQQITSRVQGAEGNISTLTQTANSLQSQITAANGDISSITQTVSSIISSVRNLEGEVSNIKQSANNITLSVTGGLGDNASIVLDVNGNKKTTNLDLSNVRKSFANDNSSVAISGGRITFNSNTIVVNSTNLKISENGTITATNGNFSGTITGSTIRGSTLYSETSTSSVSIQGGRMHLAHNGTDVGYIGCNYWANNTSQKGITFDLNPYGSYMAWATKASVNADSFTVKLIYAAESLDISTVPGTDFRYVADRIYFDCDGQFRKSVYFGGMPTAPSGRVFSASDNSLSVQAAEGNDVCLGTGNSNGVRISADTIYLYNTTKKLVNCYNNLDMQNYSVLNTSDERLKTNIEPADVDALSVIRSIGTYSFDWIGDRRHENMGFIAQQLEAEASPDFVSVNQNDGHYSTKDLKMIPYLVKAIQQLAERLDVLDGTSTTRKMARKKQWTPVVYTDDEKEAYAASLQPDTTVAKPEQPEPVLLPAEKGVFS